MREKVIEQKLVAEVKKRGGICPKWVSPGFDGMPDRIVLLPGRHFGLVEVKETMRRYYSDVKNGRTAVGGFAMVVDVPGSNA